MSRPPKNNFLKSYLLTGATAIMSATFATATLAAPSNIMFILDGSGSMWGQVDGVAKIQIAKDAMGTLLNDLPADARLGLMTYGTKDKKSCQDHTVLNQLGSDRASIQQNIEAIKPLGKTPIALSLGWAVGAMGGETNEGAKSIVLVSDGIETCDLDPCAIAKSSQFTDVKMNIHVVGFDVDAEARKQLECIADAGNGQYFDASNLDGFNKAMEQVVEVAQAAPEPAPEPEPVVEAPKGPTITEFFRDDFDGEELGEHWAIENPNPDSFIVEGGVLTMLTTSAGSYSDDEVENVMSFTGEMPKGDWDAVLTFTGDYAAAFDRIYLGLKKDKDSYLGGAFRANYHWAASCHTTYADLFRGSGGKKEEINRSFRGTRNTHCTALNRQYDQSWDAIRADLQTKPTILTFSKRGRAYTASVKMEGYNDNETGEQLIAETEQFTSLRAPGDLVFFIERFKEDAQGEVLFNIDSFVINKVEE